MTAVLIVEDERGIREGLARAVERAGHRAVLAASLAEARTAISTEDPDCILLDIRLRDGDGLDFLRELPARGARDVPVVVATAFGDSDRAIAAMRDGAFEYLTKPFDLPLLLSTVDRAVKQRALLRGALPAERPSEARGLLVGTSAPILEVWKLIGRAAASTAPTLVTGEPGVGKELVARAIHAYSGDARGPFTAIGPASMHGLRGSAGTVFIDEVGDLDDASQSILLDALDEPERRFRVVAATTRPVTQEGSRSVLRRDLYYALAVLEIHVPPLRARRSDVPLLVAHALSGTQARAVSEEAMDLLVDYPWPGNVRELVHVLRRAAVMCGREVIDAPDLPPSVRDGISEPAAEPLASFVPLREALAAYERQLILSALSRAGGNRSEAARSLGIPRPQLYFKMQELGITPKRPRSPG